MHKRLSTAATALMATPGLTLLVMAATAMAHDRATPRDFGATSAPPSHTGVPTPNGRETASAAPVPGSKRLASRRPVVPEMPVALAIPALHNHRRPAPAALHGPRTAGVHQVRRLAAESVRHDRRTRLALITCGGPFDHTTGSYLDNVVVFAVPAAAR